jgi:hypothetical protein
MFGPLFIKRDDGRLGQRYIEASYSNSPAGPPDHPRRERQVAFALRNCTDPVIANVARGIGGTTGRASGASRWSAGRR